MPSTILKYHPSAFEDVINQIFKLKYPEYGKAEAIRQHLRNVIPDEFAGHLLYRSTIDSISFKLSKKRAISKAQWNNNIQQMLTVSYSLKTEIAKQDGKPLAKTPVHVLVITVIAFLALSAILWSFNYIIQWSWLENHPQKLPIYASWQLALTIAAFYFYKNKKLSVSGVVLPLFLFAIPFLSYL